MASPHLLLVEDDKFISRAYKDGLEREGFDVDTAFDGVEAMEKIRASSPNLVLLDLILPEKDGFAVLEEVRMDESLKHVPIIILSNLGQESDIEKGRSLGALDYLIKADVSMKDVIEKVKFHLAKERVGH
ncbi:MAG: response regulator [Patescibacteria group bacterium]